MMDARDFLTLAENLVSGPLEAEWRSAVSRAYYAAFHVARELLHHCNFRVPRDEKAHVYLTRRLGNAGHPDTDAAGRKLDTLRTERNRADYHFLVFFDHAAAHTQVLAAGEIIQALDAAAQEPLKTQITDAIKNYERNVLQNVTWHP
jgi:uncharacterized protein (UPF0332 family)